MDRPIFSQIPLKPITSNTGQGTKKQTNQIQTSFTQQFNQALANESNHLIISKHASERLQQRGIHIDSNQWGKISAKVAEAKDKGVTESLVIVKNAALVVSAKNETVITAMNLQEASEQIFTNINGAIIVN
ncbi:TIGR02530 family flagellar biosynthesis protein [Heyndrickxia sporothermodurans]